MRPFRLRLVPLLLATALTSVRAAETRQPATLIREYKGAYPDQFNAQYDQIRLWVRQAQLEVSSQLGLLQYQEGFRYPLEIRFEDGAPAHAEHTLAYVGLGRNKDEFFQVLVINIAACAKNAIGLQSVFFHEMTHAVMNDAVGGQSAARLPRWLHEGLAQFIAGDGEMRLKELTKTYRKAYFLNFGFDLDSPEASFAYPEYYLGVKYIHEKRGITALQTLVRNLIAGQPYHRALQDALNQDPAAFKQSVREYSQRYFNDRALPDY